MKKPGFEELQLFESLVKTGNLSLTAKEIHVPISTASHHLSYLREFFDDQLFSRTKDGMAVTRRGLECYEKILPVLKAYEELEKPESLDLATVKRQVRIGCVDNAPFSLFPTLISDTLKVAPNVSFKVSVPSDKQLDQLRKNEIDLLVTPIHDELPAGFHSLVLTENRYVLVAGSHHPLVKLQEKYSEGIPDKEVCKYPFIDIAFNRYNKTFMLRDIVFPTWKHCTVAAETPFFLSFVTSLRNNELVMVLPLKTAMALQKAKTISIIKTKAQSVVHHPKLIWYQSTHSDPLMQWVRSLIIASCAEE